MAFNNCRQAEAYLKRNCPNYDPERIYILPKQGYSDFGFVIAYRNKVRVFHFSGDYDACRFVPKLIDYFAGKDWDENVYWEFYGHGDVPKEIFQFPSHDKMRDALDIIRDRCPGCGAKEVTRPTDMNFVVWKG